MKAPPRRAPIDPPRVYEADIDYDKSTEPLTRAIIETAVDGIITIDEFGIVQSCNPAAQLLFGYSAAEIIGHNVKLLMPPAVAAAHDGHLARYSQTGERRIIGIGRELLGRKKDGTLFPIKLAVSEARVEGKTLYAGIVRDESERHRLENDLRGQTRVLESLAMGNSLQTVLDTLIEVTEQSRPEMIGSILLLDEQLGCLRHAASRRLPSFFIEALEGMVPGPDVGSCGAAAFSGQRVIVADIHDGPLCADQQEIAARASLQACWSEPIIASCGRILGVFSSYFSTPRVPNKTDLEFVATAAKLAAIAIERVRADHSLQQLATVVESTDAAVILNNLDGIIEKWNDGAKRIYGYSAAEAIGQSIELLVPEDRIEELHSNLARIMQGERVNQLETVRLTKNGRRIHVSLTISPVRNSAGKLSHIVHVQHDITLRVQAQEEVARERAVLETIVNGIPDALMLANLDRTLTHCNQGAYRMFGYAPGELIGLPTAALYARADEYQRQGKERFNTAAEEHLEVTQIEWLRKDGEIFVGETMGTIIRDASGKPLHFVALVRDITDRQRAMKELERTRAKLVQAERLAAVGQMLSAIAHESRNALQRIQVGVDMLGFEIDGNSEARGDLERINHAKDDLVRLFDELRGYAAPFQLVASPWDLAKTWRQAWSHLELARKDRDVQLIEHTNGLDLMCHIDAFRIEQVFRNLFENSLAACDDPVHIKVTCAECNLDGTPAVCVSVRDNGPGLTTEQKNQVFEAFFTTKAKGTGLGMAIADRIIEAHRGTIEVADGRGAGAEFLIRLPRNYECLNH